MSPIGLAIIALSVMAAGASLESAQWYFYQVHTSPLPGHNLTMARSQDTMRVASMLDQRQRRWYNVQASSVDVWLFPGRHPEIALSQCSTPAFTSSIL